ncbi:MAG: DnaD domain protein [Clostridia bacterium]|nr:DnaD domain protein [Clostridia bacterium]
MKIYTLKNNIKDALGNLPNSPFLMEASAEDLRVLLVIVAGQSTADIKALAQASGCSQARVKGAIAYWEECGVLVEGEPTETPAPATPQKKGMLSSRDLAPRGEDENAAYITAHDMGELIDECQRLMGRLFNPTEIAVIVGLHEQLHLDFSYIMTLVSYCARRGKLTLRYVERMAVGLYDDGIDTTEALDQHLKRLEMASSSEGKLRRLFGIGERSLSKTEQACFVRWICDFGFDMDIIGLAYDMTVDTHQKALVKYADAILKRWYDAGCRTLAQVEELLRRETEQKAKTYTAKSKQKKVEEESCESSFCTDDFFARALERSYGKIEDKPEDE